MGLDMFALTAPSHAITQDVDFNTENVPLTELHYWRKHPNLHGWMRALYFTKGGRDANFNCASVRLTLDDLTELEQAVMSGTLPPTSGFFFGESDGSERDDDLAFIAKARDAIKAGLAVFYDAWW